VFKKYRLKFIIFEKNILAMKQLDYTAIIEKSDDGYYVGQVQEIPEAIAQGKTIEELNQNLLDALQLVIDYQRKHTISQYKGHQIIRRKLNFV
jgi:predicted RNase H-like HicB family nuclease